MAMPAIDESVFAALQDGPATETDLMDAVAEGRNMHPELVAGALRRLATAGRVVRDGGIWQIRLGGPDEEEDDSELENENLAEIVNEKTGVVTALTEHKECSECHKLQHITAFRKVRGGVRVKICANCHNAKIKLGVALAQERGVNTPGDALKEYEAAKEARKMEAALAEQLEDAEQMAARAPAPPARLTTPVERMKMADERCEANVQGAVDAARKKPQRLSPRLNIEIEFMFRFRDKAGEPWEILLTEPQARELMNELFRVLPPE